MNWRKDIIEVSELPHEEKVWVRKGLIGLKIVHPIKNEDGSWNWKNFFFGSSWLNFFIMAIIVIGISLVITEYVFNIKILLEELQQCEKFCGIVK